MKPVDYKLFQIADLICTMELLAEKADTNSFSRSEMEFFDNIRDFKKNYLNHPALLSKEEITINYLQRIAEFVGGFVFWHRFGTADHICTVTQT